jgi:hypothetical protein
MCTRVLSLGKSAVLTGYMAKLPYLLLRRNDLKAAASVRVSYRLITVLYLSQQSFFRNRNLAPRARRRWQPGLPASIAPNVEIKTDDAGFR